MADKYKPGIKLGGTLGPLGKYPIALADQIAFADGTYLKAYIDAHAGGIQWVFGHGDPPADLTLAPGQRYLDEDTGRVWALDEGQTS